MSYTDKFCFQKNLLAPENAIRPLRCKHLVLVFHFSLGIIAWPSNFVVFAMNFRGHNLSWRSQSGLLATLLLWTGTAKWAGTRRPDRVFRRGNRGLLYQEGTMLGRQQPFGGGHLPIDVIPAPEAKQRELQAEAARTFLWDRCVRLGGAPCPAARSIDLFST